MIEAGDGAGLSQIRFGIFGPADEVGVRHLDGDGPLQLIVVSQVDETEAALAEDSLHPIATDLLWLLLIGGNDNQWWISGRPAREQRYRIGLSWAMSLKGRGYGNDGDDCTRRKVGSPRKTRGDENAGADEHGHDPHSHRGQERTWLTHCLDLLLPRRGI